MFSCVGFCPRCCEGRCVTGLLLSRSSPQCVVLARDGCSVHADDLHIPYHLSSLKTLKITNFTSTYHIYHTCQTPEVPPSCPCPTCLSLMRFARQTRCSYSLVTPYPRSIPLSSSICYIGLHIPISSRSSILRSCRHVDTKNSGERERSTYIRGGASLR